MRIPMLLALVVFVVILLTEPTEGNTIQDMESCQTLYKQRMFQNAHQRLASNPRLTTLRWDDELLAFKDQVDGLLYLINFKASEPTLVPYRDVSMTAPHITSLLPKPFPDGSFEMNTYEQGQLVFYNPKGHRMVRNSHTAVGSSGYSTSNTLQDAVFGSAANITMETVTIPNSAVMVADTDNHCIRLMSFTFSVINLFAGQCTKPGSADGGLLTAQFDRPYALASSKIDGALVVLDKNGLRLVSNQQVVTAAFPQGKRMSFVANGVGSMNAFVADSCEVYGYQFLTHTWYRIVAYDVESCGIRAITLINQTLVVTVADEYGVWTDQVVVGQPCGAISTPDPTPPPTLPPPTPNPRTPEPPTINISTPSPSDGSFRQPNPSANADLNANQVIVIVVVVVIALLVIIAIVAFAIVQRSKYQQRRSVTVSDNHGISQRTREYLDEQQQMGAVPRAPVIEPEISSTTKHDRRSEGVVRIVVNNNPSTTADRERLSPASGAGSGYDMPSASQRGENSIRGDDALVGLAKNINMEESNNVPNADRSLGGESSILPEASASRNVVNNSGLGGGSASIKRSQGDSRTRDSECNSVMTVNAVMADEVLQRERIRLVSEGSYIKMKLLGRGSNGSVFSCVLDDGSLIAMKEMLISGEDITPECLKAVEEEVDLVKTLRHPNVIRYYGMKHIEDDGKILLFMELASSGTLSTMLKHVEDKLPESVVKLYMKQIVGGLAFIHDKGVLHRDLKCDNVLLTSEGICKLADFGASKVVDIGKSRAANTIIGTPLFMAPEILMAGMCDDEEEDDETGYGAMADIWSLGILTLELLNRGNAPWPDFPNQAAAFMHIASPEGVPLIPDTLSIECKDFVRKCCNRKPKQRASAASLVQHPWLTGEKMEEAPLEVEATAAFTNSQQEDDKEMKQETEDLPPAANAQPQSASVAEDPVRDDTTGGDVGDGDIDGAEMDDIELQVMDSKAIAAATSDEK